MAEISVRDWKNKELKTLELNSVVFDYPYKQHLIWEAVQAYRAAGRRGTHATKNRRFVSGGTRKPWKQKGTGRARVGDNRSPLWRHGGVVHGPQPRDYSWNFAKRSRRNAIRSALAHKLREGELTCLDNFELGSHKTKALETALVGGLGFAGKTLLVSADTDRNLELAARNNPRLKVIRALGVEVIDLVHYDRVVFSEAALVRLSEVLAR